MTTNRPRHHLARSRADRHAAGQSDHQILERALACRSGRDDFVSCDRLCIYLLAYFLMVLKLRWQALLTVDLERFSSKLFLRPTAKLPVGP